MSQSFWEPETVEETQPENPSEPEAAESGALALSVDDFSALEERILRAVNLVKRERLARSAAEQRAAEAEAQLAERTASAERGEKELDAMRAERDQVRKRVEHLLSQLDELEL